MNRTALDFIKAREDCRLRAYRDDGGRWTIGYGATGGAIGSGTVWTQAEADADLEKRIAALETAVSGRAAGVQLSPRQAAALISFAYNVGVSAFTFSHVIAFVRVRNWTAAAKSLLAWDHVKGMESQGLLKRRLEEAALFLEGSAWRRRCCLSRSREPEGPPGEVLKACENQLAGCASGSCPSPWSGAETCRARSMVPAASCARCSHCRAIWA